MCYGTKYLKILFWKMLSVWIGPGRDSFVGELSIPKTKTTERVTDAKIAGMIRLPESEDFSSSVKLAHSAGLDSDHRAYSARISRILL